MPSSVWVGGMRTSTMATSGLCARTFRSRSSASPAWPTTSKPGILEQANHSFAQQHRVVGDDQPHRGQPSRAGCWHAQSCRRPRRCSTLNSPSSAATRSASPRRPEPSGSAPPRPSSRTSTVSKPLLWATLTRDALGVRVLGDVGEGLGDEEVGGGLDAGRGALVDLRRQLDRDRRPGGERLERGDEPAVSQQAGVDAAGELAQLGRRLLELRGGLVQTARPPRPGPPRPLSARA